MKVLRFLTDQMHHEPESRLSRLAQERWLDWFDRTCRVATVAVTSPYDWSNEI